MQLSLPRTAPFQPALTLKTYIMSSLHHHQNLEYETYNQSEEFSVKETTKQSNLYDIADDIIQSQKNYTLNHLLRELRFITKKTLIMTYLNSTQK